MRRSMWLLCLVEVAFAQSGGGQSGGSGGGGGGGGQAAPSTPPRNILVAHVVCGALATMLFLPLGILFPRYARAFTARRWWWITHSSVMGILAMVFAIAAMGIARDQLQGTYHSVHGKLALTLLVLMSFQILLGLFVHFAKTGLSKLKTSSGRGPTNFLHIFLGLVIVAVGFATAWQGLTNQWTGNSGTGPASQGYIAAWGVIVAFTGAAYLGGLALVPRQLRIAKEESEKDGIPEGEVLTGHGPAKPRHEGAARI